MTTLPPDINPSGLLTTRPGDNAETKTKKNQQT